MRRFNLLLLFLCLIAVAPSAMAGGKIIKVLPQFLDKDGYNSKSPSLFDRDAYQAILRKHPEQRSALAFNVQWKAKDANPRTTKMRIEMHGVYGNAVRSHVMEEAVAKHGWFSTWSVLQFKGEAYKNFGDLIAWRVTLWDGDLLLAEQKSFLW